MTNRMPSGFLLLVLAAGFGGCGRAGSSTAPSAVVPPQTPQPTPGRGVDSVRDVSLSGVVYELTPAGRVPIGGVRVFLSDEQDILTDIDGSFSFRPVWVCPCSYHSQLDADVTVLSVSKDGYNDPPGRPIAPGFNGPSWLTVHIHGDTHVELELVRQ